MIDSTNINKMNYLILSTEPTEHKKKHDFGYKVPVFGQAQNVAGLNV